MTAGAFPAGFLWGAATSAYQIEGSPRADGAGDSIWDTWCREAGRVKNGETGDVACDHYRRWREDVDLMKTLGLGSYRFSVAWTRVQPEGRGPVNVAGLDFYERLVDALLAAGIVPNLTLYHWDLPAALARRGGWLSPDSPDRFAEYAALVARRLGDRVPWWSTLNEPWVIVEDGFQSGNHPPGLRDTASALKAAHHLLLAHGRGVRALRAETDAHIGLVVNIEPKAPVDDTPDSVAAARRADIAMNRRYLDPTVLGRSPAGIESVYGELWREPTAAEFAEMSPPLDWLGLNYYTSVLVRRDDTVVPTRARSVPRPGATRSLMGWEFRPDDLRRTLVRLSRDYPGLPLMVTENGVALRDPAPVDGVIEDTQRVAYFRSHIDAVAQARAEGADVRGYYAWSLLDNFEWSMGYDPTFGIVGVDRETGARLPKRSALAYAERIRQD